MTLDLCCIFGVKTKILDDFSKENSKNIVLKNNTLTIEEYEFVDNLDNKVRLFTEYETVIRTVKNDEAS